MALQQRRKRRTRRSCSTSSWTRCRCWTACTKHTRQAAMPCMRFIDFHAALRALLCQCWMGKQHIVALAVPETCGEAWGAQLMVCFQASPRPFSGSIPQQAWVAKYGRIPI